MAAIFGTESFEGGAVGDPITAANTTYSSVLDGWTFADDPAPAVGLGDQYAAVEVGAAATSYAQATFTATPIVVPRMYVRFPAVPPTGSVDLATARAGTSLRARLGIVNGKFVIRNGGTVVWTSTTSVPASTWCRLEWRLNTDLGEQQLRIFLGTNHHGTVADEDSGTKTLTTGTDISAVRVGPANNALTVAWTAFYDAVVISDVTWPGPGFTPTGGGPVTVDVGADQIAVEPWATITLEASETGTGITGRQWSQTQGSAVVLTGATTDTATFEAPAFINGASLTFKYAATTAADVAEDLVNVTVRAVTERAVVGGKEVPMRVVDVVADSDPTAWNPAAAWQGGQTWGQD